tara:strand:- start:1646 stop:2236 length:591 start_codon:yes stop_codon:yes gene_type:complete
VKKADELNAGTTQVDPATTRENQQQEKIIDIKVDYLDIVKARDNNNLKETHLKYNCNGEKSGEIHFYTDDSGLRFIEHVHAEYDHHQAKDQYFIKDGKLFFIFLEKTDWSFVESQAAENATQDKITEERYYIAGDTLINCLTKQYTVRSDAENNTRSEDIPNKKANCPPIEDLMSQYNLLLKYADKKGSIKCLEEG